MFPSLLVMISFRGTDGTINIVQDLTSAILGTAPFCNGCKAAMTFVGVYSSIQNQV